jgi:hypothetical protein
MAKFRLNSEEQVDEGVDQAVEEQVDDDQAVEEQVDDDQAVEEQVDDEGVETPVDEDVLAVSLDESEDDTELPPETPNWVKDVRTQNRTVRRQNAQLARELRELKVKLNTAGPKPKPELGPQPDIADFAYDTVKYADALAKWLEDKKAIDEEVNKKVAEEKAQADAWQAQLAAYGTAKTTLGVKDFDDAESVVLVELDAVQQGIIVSGAKDAALLVYAIGKNEAAAKKLAAIKDPVKFAFAVARMEAQMKVAGKKPGTAPEKKLSGGTSSTAMAGAPNAVLARLRAEAEKTNDYTKLAAYKAKLKVGSSK